MRRAQVGALLSALLLPGLALAQAPSTPAPMPAATGASATFAINGFEVTGDVPLPAAQTDAVLAPFIGPGATIETLQKATAALEAAYKAQGFALHRVTLPAQEVGQKIKLVIVKFVIGKVTVSGNTAFTEANIRASLPELVENQAPNFSRLAVQTAIANENPSKQVKVSLKESEEANKIDATLQVKEAKPWNFSASLANTGSDATGQDRLSVVGGHSSLWGLDHQFSGAYTTSIERSSDVKQLGLNYRIPFYKRGGVLGVSYTTSDVVGNFGTFTSTGAGQTYGINYSHYLGPVGGRRSYLTYGLDEKQFKANRLNNAPLALGQPELTSSRPLSVGYNARIESDTAVWGYNAELALNVPGGNGNNLTDYQNANAGSAAPNLRINTVNWKLLRGGANYLTALANGWLWGVRGQFQYSADALIPGEQFGLGGANSVRGTGERLVTGDSGVFASMEFTSPALAPGLNALLFVDGGWLNNRNSAVSGTESDQLLSVGLGLRYQTNKLSLTADWGRVVTGSSVPLSVNPNAPQAGADKLHLNMTARF
ncbi:MAG: hypothetical protein AUJ20_03300 [Comamonadaceae bacterium CG1_02_60_18]|nr:MAG: hypothetical protein AUJ20_03300 [Comamonadaceae bacterium CG1_02_60_18]